MLPESINGLWLRIKAVFRRRQLERDLADELEFHLAMREEKLAESGVAAEEAPHAARRRFGNAARAKESSRELWTFPFLETIWQDTRYGLRQLRRNPGFTIVAIVTLALGIGANTTIFSLLDGVLFRPLPVPHPQQLVLFTWANSGGFEFDGGTAQAGCPSGDCSFSYPVFESIHDEQKSFTSTFSFLDSGPMLLSYHGHGRQAQGDFVSGDYFSTLGLPASLGRTLEPHDDSPSAAPAIVLSYSFWRSRFAADPSLVGKTVYLDRRPFTVAGVAAPDFFGLNAGLPADFWVPMVFEPTLGTWHWSTANRRVLSFAIWGRLKTGVSLAEAQAATNAIFVRDVTAGPNALVKLASRPALTLLRAPGGMDSLRQSYSHPLLLLLTLTGILILLACANVAGLTLARSVGRQREVAVRFALGTSRWRLIRHLVTESLLLAAAGGAMGVLVGYAGAGSVVAFFSANTSNSLAPLRIDVVPDFHVLGFAFLAATLVGVLAGLAPAIRSARVDLTPALNGDSLSSVRGGRAWRRLGFGSTLVVGQIALSVLVLVGAGLLVRSVANRETLPLGFEPHHLLTLTIDPTLAGLKDPQLTALYSRLQARIEAAPGVISATYASVAPMSGSVTEGMTTYQVPALPEHLISTRLGSLPEMTEVVGVGPRFFRTLGVRVAEGRSFDEENFLQSPALLRSAGAKSGHASAKFPASRPKPVPVLVNEAFVKQTFGKRNPLGYEITYAGPIAAARIIGVVPDFAYNSPRLPTQGWSEASYFGAPGDRPVMFCILGGGSASLVIRTAPDPKVLIPSVRRIVSEENSELVLTSVSTVTGGLARLIYRQRLIGWLSSLFAVLALLLSCIGLYGLLAGEVARRTREVGIRLALGAPREAVLRMVLWRGAKLAFFGAIGGIALALALTRLLRHFLFGVSATDPLSFAAGGCLLLAVALAACYVPAWRASRVDPVTALKYE